MIYRFPTREVKIGRVGVGGKNPVRIQSMTNTNTLDTGATVDQILRLADAGCEIIRLAVPGTKEARHLEVIKSEMLRSGCSIPLIADVHFNPEAALISAELVEKVRINPGNYTDRNTGRVNFSDQDFHDARERITAKIAPLIEICRKNNTVLRIGSNHGSLSERIVSRYGNTPEGMVEAALEFVRICRDFDFHQIVLSMKASSVRTMVYANRLLVKQMLAEGMNYPIHLGVTEAGNAAEGRIKSAIGCGSLLAGGIGDTIRVSLTEDPVNEIPVAREIVEYFERIPHCTDKSGDHFTHLAHSYQPTESDMSLFKLNEKSPLVVNFPDNYLGLKPDLQPDAEQLRVDFSPIQGLADLNEDSFAKQLPIIFESIEKEGIAEFEEFISRKIAAKSSLPVILKKSYQQKDFLVEAAIDFGPLFLDGLANGIWICSENTTNHELVDLSYMILQASGARISKTEYIACPSCGRTLYDIQSSLEAIKTATSHLKGLKIAVMGCIVNGPGEMADADYGYVGMGAGKVALFKGKSLIKKAVPESEAIEQLVGIIKENGDWMEME